MRKENLNGQGKEVISLSDFPENLERTANLLIKRNQEISFEPQEYSKALSLLPDLKKYAQVY
jgi:hypothetical protein